MTSVGLRDYLGRGHHDDGREGIVLAKIAAGDLVHVPFGVGGAGVTHNIGSATAALQQSLTTNPDRSTTGVNFSVPPGLGQSAVWSEQLYGSMLGIRWRRNNSATLLPFSVVVNGRAKVRRNVRYHADSVLTTATDGEAFWIFAKDLGPGPHSVKVVVHSDAYGATTKALLAYGWLLERSAGYAPQPEWSTYGVPVALVAGATALVATLTYSKLIFTNTDSVARSVLLKSGSSVIKEIQLGAAGATTAPLASAEFEVGSRPMVGSSAFTMTPSAAGVVNYTPIYGMPR